MRQKPLQDIYTAVLLAGFFLLVAMTGAMAATILEQSGIVPSDASLTSLQAENPTALTAVRERKGFNDCEVVYHLASGSGEYAGVMSPENEQDGAYVMYYAVYTCTGTLATTADYI